MTQEEKELLLKDLSARLPYGVKVQVADYKTPVKLSHIDTKNGNGRKPYCFVFAFEPERVKPYLRSLLSMTEKEKEYLNCLCYHNIGVQDNMLQGYFCGCEINDVIDWLLKNHFDFRGLIPKNLAIEVTKENNPYNKMEE